MSALVVDTSSWISYLGGQSEHEVLIEESLAEGRVHLPVVVAAELLSGRLTAKQRAALEDLLGDLPLCGTELVHWFRVGRLRNALAGKGVAVSTPDAHVAQCAIDLDATLMTEDDVFRKLGKHQSIRLHR